VIVLLVEKGEVFRKMPRNYKPKPGQRQYKRYSDTVLSAAVTSVKCGGLSYRQAAVKFGILR